MQSENMFFTLGHSPIIESLATEFDLIPLKPKNFSDGEFFVRIPENVRNQDCYLIVDMTPANVFEVIITINTLKKACAKKVTLVAPYLPYSRQDRRVDTRTPMSAKVLATMLETAGVDHVITMDVHALQIECFYNVPFDNLQGSAFLIREILDRKVLPVNNEIELPISINRENTILVSPDAGAMKRTRHLAELLGFQVAMLDKKRISDIEVRSYLIGEVEGKNCLMLDDMISSGGTIITGAESLKNAGAKDVYAGCIHMLAKEDNLQALQNSRLTGVFSLNTRNINRKKITKNYNSVDKIQVVDVSSIFADAIRRDASGMSVSSMFNQ